MIPELDPIPDGSPWLYVDGELSDGITQELRKEVSPQHMLYPWIENLVAIAKCSANDDVIVADKDDIQNMFWVHLTWSGKIDQYPDKYPSAAPIQKAHLQRFFLEY